MLETQALFSESNLIYFLKFFFCFFFLYSIEQCLKDLQSEVNEICTDEILQSTNDCLQWLNNCNFISLKPSSTPHGELMEFLRTLVKNCLLRSLMFGKVYYMMLMVCFFVCFFPVSFISVFTIVNIVQKI